MREVTRYIAKDGAEFSYKTECIAHEEVSTRKQDAEKFVSLNYAESKPKYQKTVLKIICAWLLWDALGNDDTDEDPIPPQ